MTTDDCSVCTDKYTQFLRTKITCSYCSYHACKGCVSRYLLSQVVDAHCMNCRTGWNREFLDTNFTKSFRSGLWRDHQKEIIMRREKARLPNFQHYAVARLKINELKPLVSAAYKEYTLVQNEKYKLNSHIATFHGLSNRANTEEEKKNIINLHKEAVHLLPNIMIKEFENLRNYENIQHRFQEYNNIYEDRVTKKDVEKKEFIMKCVKDGCRGFLSQAYKCDLCFTYVCKDCMVIKNEKNDETHVCSKEDVDSVTMIRKETKPCPKCGIRISKVDGCNQMWCTSAGCGTAFDWTTNKIISGVIHNPHYYEWLRRNNNGVAPRPAGEVLCGGIPNYSQLLNPIRLLRYTEETNLFLKFTKDISNIHSCLIDLQYERIPSYNVERNINTFKEFHVNFLINKITEAEWIRNLYMKENAIEKKQQIGLIIQTFFNVASDYMRTMISTLTTISQNKSPKLLSYNITNEEYKLINNIMVDFEKLRLYINENLANLGKIFPCAVPQFNEIWRFIPSSRIDKNEVEAAT